MSNTELHPLIAACAREIAASRGRVFPCMARVELEHGLRTFAEKADLAWALESLTVLAHRVELLGEHALAQALVGIAVRSVPALLLQQSERALRRMAARAPRRPRSSDVVEAGDAAWKLTGVAAVRRRA